MVKGVLVKQITNFQLKVSTTALGSCKLHVIFKQHIIYGNLVLIHWRKCTYSNYLMYLIQV